MNIPLTEVRKRRGQIEQLVLRAYESSMYLVQVRLVRNEPLLNVCDDQGTILRFHSQLDAKLPFKGLGIRNTILIHDSPYNEMIGMPTGDRPAPLEVKLANPDADCS